VHRLAGRALQPVAVHQAIDLHVPDQCLDHAAPAEPGAPPAALSGCATALPRQDDPGTRSGLMAPIALVRHRGLDLAPGVQGGLGQ
jgi:hypothetical protein